MSALRKRKREVKLRTAERANPRPRSAVSSAHSGASASRPEIIKRSGSGARQSHGDACGEHGQRVLESSWSEESVSQVDHEYGHKHITRVKGRGPRGEQPEHQCQPPEELHEGDHHARNHRQRDSQLMHGTAYSFKMQLRPRTVQDCVLNRGPRPMKPRIFVTRPLPPAVLDRLATRCEMRLHPQDTPLSPAQLAEACRDQEGVVVCGARFNEEALLQATRLRVVSNVGVGYDNIDVAACTRRRVPVTNAASVV